MLLPVLFLELVLMIFALNFLQQVLFAANEVFVRKAVLIGVHFAFAEVVHVQLAHEGREGVVFEIERQHGVGELVLLSDYEGVALFVPTDYMFPSFILQRVKGKEWLR